MPLGVYEVCGIRRSIIREKKNSSLSGRRATIKRSIIEFNIRNMIEAVNNLVIWDVTYSFNSINWSITEINQPH